MLKFQEAAKYVSGSRAVPTYPKALVARRKVLKEISVGELDPNDTVQANLEAQLLSKLDHPAIVKFHASFVEQDNFCIITEYCEGRDLDCKIQEYKEAGKTFSEGQIIEWFIQLLLGVDYMHERRILHRDLKSKNIFLKNNLLKIGDFGVSRLLMGSCDLATTLTGTPHYMSPEALKHQGYDTKSDICMLNKNPSLRPSAIEILKIPFIDEQLQHLICRYSEMSPEDKNLNCQKETAHIINAMQKQIHLQTLRALSEVQKMTPRERMRLRKLQAADEKASKLKKLVEEKYEENNKRMQELRSRNFQQLTVDVLHESDGPTPENLPESRPIPCPDLGALEPRVEDTIADLGDRGIPEDPRVAEEYYADTFDSCSEESEEEEEGTVLAGLEAKVRDQGPQPDCRGSQQGSESVLSWQRSDTESLVRCLESVLGGTSLDTRTVTSAVPDVFPGPTIFNRAMAGTEMQRMRESAMQKLGAAVFEEVYHYLKRARRQRACEAEVRASLEKVVPRASDCFEIDQLLYFEEQLLITTGEGPTLQNHHKQLPKASKFKGTHFCANPSDT